MSGRLNDCLRDSCAALPRNAGHPCGNQGPSANFALDSTKRTSKAEAILLVDDDDLYVRATTRLLRALGYPFVYRCPSAADAIEMLGRIRPSLVFTDMVMEHRNAGREVVAACRKLGVDVAVVSGMPDLDGESLGCRLCRKSDLSGSALEQLIVQMVSDKQQRTMDSIRPAMGQPTASSLRTG